MPPRAQMAINTELRVPLLYSEFFGRVPAREELAQLVRELHWQKVVMWTSGILCISWQDGVEDPKHQRELADEFTKGLLYGAAVQMRLLQPHRLLFSRESLLAVLRIAVSEGSSPDWLHDEADIFVRAILAANELLALEITPHEVTSTPADLLATEVRSNVMHLEKPHDLLARSAAFFEWSETPKAKKSENYRNVRSDFKTFTGLTPLEYAAGAYFTFSRCSAMATWSEVERLGVAFSIEQWQAGMSDTRVIREWFSANSVALEEIKLEWKSEKSLSMAAAGTLWRKPIVQVEPDLYFIPAPELVENKMGNGTYFALLDGYRKAAGGDPAAQAAALGLFSRFYGEFFEEHIAEIFERSYRHRKDALFTREIDDGPGCKSTDVIIAEGNDVLFIEVVSKRMNLRESVVALSPRKISDDLKAGVIEKADQLDKNIKRFRSRKLLPNWPRPSGQRFFPVVVAPHDWPRVNLLTRQLEEAQNNGLLAGAEPLEMLDLGEVEQLENGLTSGVSLAGILDRKNRSTPHNRLRSLHNYLIFAEPGTLARGMSPTRIAGSAIAKAIISLAESWAQPLAPA